METKGKWFVEGDKILCKRTGKQGTGYWFIAQGGTVSNLKEATTNANLICEAVNACVSVNPSEPLKVAQSIKAMYEGIRGYLEARKLGLDGTYYHARMKQVLANIGGK